MKKSSIYSQGLRIKRLCSDGHKLQKHLENPKNWFCERGYPGGLIDAQLQKVCLFSFCTKFKESFDEI